MDFTEIYRQSSSLVAFSPGGHFVLTALQDRIIVRRTDTFQITRTWLVDASPSQTNLFLSNKQNVNVKAKSSQTSSSLASDNWITHCGWSCDSEYILAAFAKRGVVHILKLRDEDWSGRIEAGTEGLTKAEWAPDGRTILCFSEWGLRVTLWSLVTGTATYIQFPIHPDRGYAFRADGRYFILGERHKSKDTLGVYDAAESYRLMRHFPLPTSSLSSFAVSPTGNHIAVWEGPLDYKLHVLTLAGNLLATFSPEPDPGFGIRNVAWHPNGMFLAVGGWDDRIHILDSLSWSAVATLELSPRVPSTVKVWREPPKWMENTEGRGFLSYERPQGVHVLPLIRSDQTKPNPKSGTAQLEWNTTGDLLLVRFDNVPTAVHIFDFPSPQEVFVARLRSVLLHSHPVISSRWNPARKGSLVLCCGTQGVYTWSDEWVSESGEEEEMAECIGVPAQKFEARDVKWAPDGKGFILFDKDQFCCAFEVEDEEVEAM
ncbi:YVTN repeat-like/Quino protein amine dehydrogenase [Macrolepiota fuliginosa MF-IS2]|uniref:YVTN repeat-like/Quino protein amine dehydrogenase n=1 Tax=Macrolepiota fuliginosa MF-IS2 TaxID=1400762 RepID=A0A9P5XQH1_9AGAR|nr:YVTN repeat-like/Quino protein amine dehydrogenase [Macrolepiota fuliginosa MF-IS2]